jgi:hypothetical protein
VRLKFERAGVGLLALALLDGCARAVCFFTSPRGRVYSGGAGG